MERGISTGYNRDPKAREALNAFLKDIDLKRVAEDYKSFIRREKYDTQGLLILVLHRYGSKTMAEDFYNCRNGKLKKASMRWVEQHGYTISP